MLQATSTADPNDRDLSVIVNDQVTTVPSVDRSEQSCKRPVTVAINHELHTGTSNFGGCLCNTGRVAEAAQ